MLLLILRYRSTCTTRARQDGVTSPETAAGVWLIAYLAAGRRPLWAGSKEFAGRDYIKLRLDSYVWRWPPGILPMGVRAVGARIVEA